MNPHILELPRKIVVGKNVLKEIKEICNEINATGKPIVLTGPNTKEIAGNTILETIKDKDPYIFIINNIDKEKLDSIPEKARDAGMIISVGGGKILDCGKHLSSLMNIPSISVPTAPSHDGIASERATLELGDSKFYSSKIKPPEAIIFDVDIIKNAPYRLIASGCADVIANVVSVWDWKLAQKAGKHEYYSGYAAQLALLSSEFVTRSVNMIKNREERGIRNLIQAIISSGMSMSLAGSSAPASGSEHMFSHTLDKFGSKALHGEQCGVGAIMIAYLQNQDWERIRESLKTLNAPVTAKELGVDDEMIIKALVDAPNIRDRHTILTEKPLDEEKARDLAIKTGVIK
ncbi:MAG: sn-glycerol-1-phosphate dehydrogenase [Nanoarchaeota archaeon]